ncbi:MAG: GH92 family glycosyl hydrolase [Prevotella sp.]|nr:GH92 family glycosyl hydrolase [Prevotella sp.]
MKNKHLTLKALVLFGLMLAFSCTSTNDPLRLADPFVGTGLHGHTYPGAASPFGMVQLSPDTRSGGWDGVSGYHAEDSTIIGFSHTHLSGTGEGDMGDFIFTPVVGDVTKGDNGFEVSPLPFKQSDEEAYPGYYSVDIPTLGIKAELTATQRTGCHRYTFSGVGERHLLVDMAYVLCDKKADQIRFSTPTNTCIEGGRHVVGWAKDRWMYFSAEFSTPYTECIHDGHDRYLLTFPSDMKELTVCVGLSPVDEKGARNNLTAEVPVCNFDSIHQSVSNKWTEELGKIRIEGGSETDRSLFYTALYHSLIVPHLLSDVDGRYRNHRQEVKTVPSGRRYYSTLSLWDTFRSWHPLQTIINPEIDNDIVFSLLDMYDCDGKLPLWPLGGADTDCMIGYHGVAVIADAWLRGIRDFDGEHALKAMVSSSNQDPASEWYNTYGYIPCDLSPQSISKTLEFAYDDWCIARMAESLGHDDIAAEYDLRAKRYKNIFDPTTGFFRGRDSEGNWREPFDPTGSSRDYTEATAWQYRFFVPHDMNGFAQLMGGKEATITALDSLFSFDYLNPTITNDGNISGFIGQYAHGNEPSHTFAWLYSFMNHPESTQRRVRQVLKELYTPDRAGICGNEDCGQMSAWYVLAAIGLYPACPGTGEFVFAAPLFKKTTISLPNGKTLVITADKPNYAYIKEVTFNGETVDAQYITYDKLMQGGELSFVLSRKPSKALDDRKVPYSLTQGLMASTPRLKGNPRFFENTFNVELDSRTPEAKIYYTLDGSEPTEESTLYTAPFTIDKDCQVKAKAFVKDGEPSPLMSIHAFPIIYQQAVNVTNTQPGCRFTYHRGMFTWTRDVARSPIVKSGVLPAPSIAGATDEDHFGFIFDGYLDIPEDGLWEFAVTSDDGAVLLLDGKLAVNGDGSHSNYTATGYIALLKGMHQFRLLYLEDYEGQNLEWAWKAPSAAEFAPIPESAISH